MKIKVVDDYTDTPGARYERQGPFSGERFRDEILYPKFLYCVKNHKKLTVDLDGGYGYGSSFLEETFGGLVRKLRNEKKTKYIKYVKEIIIISEDNKSWYEKIDKYISDETRKGE